MTTTHNPIYLVVSALFLMSCGLGGGDPAGQLHIDSQCTLTSCKAQEQKCVADRDSQCDSCWDSVSELVTWGGDVYDCSPMCDTSSCYRTCPENDSCVEYDFTATLPEQRDEALYQACMQAEARDQRCGLTSAAPLNCDAYARVERAEATQVYQCWAQTPCDKSPAPCNDLLATGVAQLYCSGFVGICGAAPTECASPDQLDTDLFNWQRDQVNSEILRCLELDCAAAQQCVIAFFVAMV